MKIVCDACLAKYSISDDKVQGKVFKIRCKKCSNIIVVRGGASAEPAPAPQQDKGTRVYDYGYDGGEHAPAGDESVWHVVINQEQVGPMTAVDVRARFANGELDAESYVWREGFADWMVLSQVEAFASLAAGGGAAPAAPAVRGAGTSSVASMFGEDVASARSDPGDLFAAASVRARQDDDGGDLFGGKPAALPSAGVAKLRGERNENSVLFSLNNLAQLASDKPPPTAVAATAAPGAATASSGGEGSGLIDIRSMASAYLGGPGSGAAKPAPAGIGSIDDLPVFGGGGFSEPAVIVPIASRSNPNKLMYALIASVGALVVAAVVVVIVLLRGGGGTATQVAAADKPEPVEKQAAKAEVPDPAAQARPADPGTPTTLPRPTDPVASPGNDGRSGGKSGGRSEPKPREPDAKPADSTGEKHAAVTHKQPPSPAAAAPASTPRQPKSSSAATPPPAPRDPPPPKDTPKDAGKNDSGCDEVSCVLNNYVDACCAKFRKGGAKPSGGGAQSAAKSDLPEALDRTMISDGVAKVKGRVISCGEKSPARGQVKVSVKVAPDGHVVSVTVKDTPDTALGNCVSGMMQKATFAKTQTGGSFSYPYTF